MKKTLILILFVNLLIFSTIGCVNNNSTPNDELIKVQVLLDWFPNTNHTGLYVAKENGYYEELGLNVEIIQPAEGVTAQLIAAGQAQFGVSYQEEITYARAEDIPLVAIATIIQHNTSGFASPKESNITTPKDFENKTYGGWGSEAEMAVLKAIMDNNNADFEKLEMVNIGSADFFASIERDVDFGWIYWGWTGIEAELRGIDLNFIKLKDEHQALDYYTPVLITNETLINQNPELVEKFLKATSKGYEFAINNPNQAADILVRNVPELNEELAKASQEYLANEYKADATRWGVMDSKVWQNYSEFMYNNNLISKRIDVEKAFTNEFLPKE